MKVSQNCIDNICVFEGLKLKAYICPAGVLTIGYGHTSKDVYAGQEITRFEALELLRKDLERFENGVISLVSVKLSQGQFDSLVSFSFNVGLQALRSSTLLRKLNYYEYIEAREEFLKWNKAKVKGKMVELAGLTKRRKWEYDNFV